MKEIQHDKMSTGEVAAVAAVRSHLCANLRNAENLTQALEVFQGGIENANDTVFLDKAAPRSEWLDMFVASMATLLSRRYIHMRVLTVFAAIRVQP